MNLIIGHCHECIFSNRGSYGLECRRHAPEIGVNEFGGLTLSALPVWPIVLEMDWCGDHQPISVTFKTDEGNRVDQA